jgi:uroporphyrin-III C-methyltransferase/precorrin-2 dehydrogenase/sirohydrochlorin ferrochelatase
MSDLPTPQVYLVGAGPGDPELLTLRAAKLLQHADVVVYDNLVSDGVLALISPTAERIFVGKRAGHHTLSQEEINQVLVRLWQEAPRRIVRLKGGDPLIFGRGGEEAWALAAAGVPFEIVPGITAACGMAASNALPLTHRGVAQACLFVTGHLQNGKLNLDWPALARPKQTVVFYMGVSTLPELCAQLIAHGRAPETPAAIIQAATTPQERRIVGSLATLPAIAKAAEVHPPALIVVGEVIRVAQGLEAMRPFASAAPKETNPSHTTQTADKVSR